MIPDFPKENEIDAAISLIEVAPIGTALMMIVLFGWANWRFVIKPILDWKRENEESDN